MQKFEPFEEEQEVLYYSEEYVYYTSGEGEGVEAREGGKQGEEGDAVTIEEEEGEGEEGRRGLHNLVSVLGSGVEGRGREGGLVAVVTFVTVVMVRVM